MNIYQKSIGGILYKFYFLEKNGKKNDIKNKIRKNIFKSNISYITEQQKYKSITLNYVRKIKKIKKSL